MRVTQTQTRSRCSNERSAPFSCPCFSCPHDMQSQSNAEPDKQSQSSARTHGRECSRSRTRADDKQSTVPRMRDTVRAVPQISMPMQSVVPRARPPSVPSNDFSCPRSRTHGQTDKHAPCTHLCPACLIAQLDTKSVTDTPRATCVHMPACPLAVQLAFPWALPMRTHVPHMPRQFSRPVCASVDIPMDQLP